MMSITKRLSSVLAAVVAVGTMTAMLAPAAEASDASHDAVAVTSARSFPKVNTAKKDLLAEATSTQVESDSDWGGIESLDVPQTESQAEREQRETQEAAQAAADAAAASRTASRDEVASTDTTTTGNIDPPASSDAAALAAYASQFVGYPYVYGGNQPGGWDCSGFTQWVFAQFGYNIGRTTGDQIHAGTIVSDPQPGDLMISTDVSHAGIYLGNGLMVHALSPAYGTRITAVTAITPSSYYYIRVF